MTFPVFDLHCDTALALMGKDMMTPGKLSGNDLHIDLERAKTLPGYAQCFACFTTPMMRDWHQVAPETVFQAEMDVLMGQLEANKKVISQAFTADDVRKNYEKGKMSAIFTIEGPAGFGFEPELLPMLHAAGFRMSTLGWNEQNVLIGSHRTGGGLTDLGRAYMKTCQELGIVVDVSHCSDEGFWDIIKNSTKPIVASHSNSRAVHDVSRNLTDDMFRAIMETGGVAGLNLYTDFIGDNATIDTACDHILHWLELDPEGKHIALGGDLDGCDALPAGFEGIQSYPALARRLRERGVDDKLIYNLYWNNALGVMDTCCM